MTRVRATSQAALFGPVSLLNAACEHCSNAYFERTDNRHEREYVAILKQPGVRKGCQLTVQYAQGDEELLCGTCGCAC